MVRTTETGLGEGYLDLRATPATDDTTRQSESTLLRSREYMRDPITLLPMGKDMLQKTRIALFVDSTLSSYNANNTHDGRPRDEHAIKFLAL